MHGLPPRAIEGLLPEEGPREDVGHLMAPGSTGSCAASACTPREQPAAVKALTAVLALVAVVVVARDIAGRRGTAKGGAIFAPSMQAANPSLRIAARLFPTGSAHLAARKRRVIRETAEGGDAPRVVTSANQRVADVPAARLPSCRHNDTSCRARACRQLHSKARAIPLHQLGFPMHMNTPEQGRIGFSDVFVDRTSAGKLSSLSALLPVSAKALKGKTKFKSCAIVGSSGSLLMAEHGREIDSHSAVFRINRAPTEGYSAHTGNKTNFRLLNAKWTARYAAGSR